MKKAICETIGIRKDFIQSDDRILHVLGKIDIQIYPDEILAIIGPSGCGKSTLIRVLTGLIPPTEGQVYYHGKKITGLLPNFALVFQNFALYPWMTVRQNIEIVLKALNLPKEEIAARTLDAITLVGLSGFEEAYPKEISGGMKQRVGFARALVCNPEILILDEPFSALDAFTAETLRDELLNIWKTKKSDLSSIIIISHDVREVAFLADRILMLEANPGRVRFALNNTLPRPRNYQSKEFLQFVDQLHNSYVQGETLPIEPIAPLLPVNPDEILGFLSHIARFDKPFDLSQIGIGNLSHFDHTLLIAEAAEFLHFVDFFKHTITLLPLGNKFLSADRHGRQQIWKAELLTVPLFHKVLEWLQSAPKHILRLSELEALIAKELPHEDAQTQSKLIVSWGSYGHLLNYHKLSKTLSQL